MHCHLIHNIRPPGIPVFPFGDTSCLARTTNPGSLGAYGRIAIVILSQSLVAIYEAAWAEVNSALEAPSPVKSFLRNAPPTTVAGVLLLH